MKELKAFVRVERIDRILHELKKAGIARMSATHVQSIGSSIDPTEANYRSNW